MYKVFLTQVKNEKNLGTCILCEDFSSLEAAINAGEINMLTPESFFIVKEYEDTRFNIIGSKEFNTGKTVYVSPFDIAEYGFSKQHDLRSKFLYDFISQLLGTSVNTHEPNM